MKSKRSSRDPALRYARLCRFFGVSAIYFVIVVCTSGIFREMGAGALGLVVDAVLLAAGYFLMALWAKLTHFERRSDSRGYESDGGYFVFRKMILPIAVIIIAGFAIKGITARAEYEYAMSTPGVAYEPDSLYPYAVMLFCIAVMTGGAVLWFVPQERLVSQRTVACCIFAMFIPFVFYAYLGGAGGSLSPLGQFGWQGAAGSYVIVDPESRSSLFFAMHMLHNQENFVFPRLCNAFFASLE